MKKTRVPNATLALLVLLGGLRPIHSAASDEKTGTPGSERAQPTRTLKVALTRDIGTWDPARIDDPLTHEVNSAIYETLYQQDAFSKEPILRPLLAADYPQFSKDGKTATIRIRDDVKFHDHACFSRTQGKGRQVSAEDFVRALKRLALPGMNPSLSGLAGVRILGFHALQKKLAAAAKAELPQTLEEARLEGAHAADAHTLVLKFSAPWPRVSGFLSFLATAPFPNEWSDCVAANAREPWIDRIAIGTGPFIQKRWVRGQKIELERNPAYHPDFTPIPAEGENALLAGRMIPFLSRLEFEIEANPRKRLERLLSGGFDRIPYTPELRVDVLDAERRLKSSLEAKGLELLPQGVPRFHALLFGHGTKPLSDQAALRKAIAAAISRAEWAGRLLAVMADTPEFQGAPTLAASGFPALDSSAKLPGSDAEGSAKRLKEIEPPLPALNLDIGGTDPTSIAMGEAICASLGTAGIPVKLRTQTIGDFRRRMESGDFTLALATFSLDAQGPEYVFQLLHGPQASPGMNWSRFRSPAFDQLYESLLAEKSAQGRRKLTTKLAETAATNAAWVPGFASAEHFLVRKASIGFRPAHFLTLHWKYWSGR